MSQMSVGFVGLGAMGRPMAHNLHRAGLLAATFNRTYDKAAALAAETGTFAAERLEDFAGRVNAVVLCVPADADVLAAVDRLADVLEAGALVIDCSTVPPVSLKAVL